MVPGFQFQIMKAKLRYILEDNDNNGSWIIMMDHYSTKIKPLVQKIDLKNFLLVGLLH